MVPSFDANFAALTGNPPFPWQVALYERFIAGEFPASCNLPTGLGKTAVIPIWLLALAEAPRLVPRRLVYVVNRRTVVDQATREAESIRKRLQEPDVVDLLARLQALAALDQEVPLAISTLRGQFADNAEWRLDPARPAIIVGTVDMIGSRLLFSGYGCGFKTRPLHAGFLGQDTLLVHDEAHLEPAFQDLLASICDEQARCRDFKPLRVMELSATSRGNLEPFGLTQAELDGKVPVVNKRIKAVKAFHLHSVTDDKQLADRIAELALQHAESGKAILVYARRVEDVEKIVKRLPKGTLQLTGTMRGLERDRLIREIVFKRFLPPKENAGELDTESSAKPATAYLVCTSAGEVGINISADHLVCDLTHFDSMAQRLGRVNRFGNGEAIVGVVHPETFADNDFEGRREKTLQLLHRLQGDGSPAALSTLPLKDRLAAFCPPPDILATSDILFDAWSLTSITSPMPGRPSVADYLHGVAEWQPADTRVAWRQEVTEIRNDWLDKYSPNDLLEDYPLKPHETLRDRYDRVFKHVERLAGNFPDEPVWVVEDDKVQVLTMSQLVKRDKDFIQDVTLLLSPTVGGLTSGGTLGDAEGGPHLDVADQWYADEEQQRQRRTRFWTASLERDPRASGMRLIRTIDITRAVDDVNPDSDEGVARLWRWYVLPRSADDDSSQNAMKPQALPPHNQQVGLAAAKFAEKLGLPDDLTKELVFAGTHHDDGKDRSVWQISIGNRSETVLAKSGNNRPPEVPTTYRHELGSVMDVREQSAAWNVALHAIAAHHGRARPHFPIEALFDPKYRDDEVETFALSVPLRFAALQHKYGRWGLAYLESLIRAADAWASANPQETNV